MRQHRQIHVWITESDYLLLREQSVEAQDSVSAILRRMIRTERDRLRAEPAAPLLGSGDLPIEALQ
jgi:hypothetical protein